MPFFYRMKINKSARLKLKKSQKHVLACFILLWQGVPPNLYKKGKLLKEKVPLVECKLFPSSCFPQLKKHPCVYSTMFRLCPIDAQWSSWPSDWSACSGSCRERGLSFPMRSRARTCIPEKNAGKDCQVLEDEAKRKGGILYREEQACSDLPCCAGSAGTCPGTWWELIHMHIDIYLAGPESWWLGK